MQCPLLPFWSEAKLTTLPMNSNLQIVTSVEADSVYDIPCKICRKQFSKYTCPKCNIPYCSLTCFRANMHDQCSENFYREEVQVDIGNAPSSSAQDRQQMMELLRRFEGSNLEEEEDSSNELADKLNGVDLNEVSADDLWKILSVEQRDAFMKALQTPSSKLAQDLLASAELQTDITEPWWNDSDLDQPNYSRPDMMSIPSGMLNGSPNTGGPSLLYNICAVCIAYAYVNRHFAISPLSKANEDDASAMRQIFSQLVPFLIDRNSKVVHPTLSSVITDMWSRFQQDQVSSSLFSLLLHDTSTLMHPRSVTNIQEYNIDSQAIPHSNCVAILALSDIASLFQQAGVVYVPRKLIFYSVHLMATPSLAVTVVANEALTRSESMGTDAVPQVPLVSILPRSNNAKRIIEELLAAKSYDEIGIRFSLPS